MCFKIVSDASIQDSLGDEIKIFKNDVDIGVALNANELSNEICFNDVEENDIFSVAVVSSFLLSSSLTVFVSESSSVLSTDFSDSD